MNILRVLLSPLPLMILAAMIATASFTDRSWIQ